jgi:hypothetical protein
LSMVWFEGLVVLCKLTHFPANFSQSFLDY